MLKTTCLLALTTLASACTTARDADVICRETDQPSADLAALAYDMTDSVAIAADRLIALLDAGCGR